MPKRRAVNYIIVKLIAWYALVSSFVLVLALFWVHHQFEQRQQRSVLMLSSLIESSVDRLAVVSSEELWWLKLDLDHSDGLPDFISSIILSRADGELLFRWQGDKTADSLRAEQTYKWRSAKGDAYVVQFALAGASSFLLSEAGSVVLFLLLQWLLLVLVLTVQVFRGMRSVLASLMRELSKVNLKKPSPLQADVSFAQFVEYRKILSVINRVILSLAKSREELYEINEDLEQRIRFKTAALEDKNEELVALNQRLSIIANTDALTQVYNRTRFDILYSEHVAVAKRRNRTLSILLIDLDNFKKVNDEYGHQVGDHVLKHSAQTITAVVKGVGVVARWGGEEFAVLLPYSNIADAEEKAELVRQAIALAKFEQADVAITTSIGVAELSAKESGSQLLKRADDALYDAKGRGRNCVVVAQQCVASPQSLEPVSFSSESFMDGGRDAVEPEPTPGGREVSAKLQSWPVLKR